MTPEEMLAKDRQYVWHPYSAIDADLPVFPVESASGVRIKLADGRELIDGMSSWWCAIHGYNHPQLNQAVENQLKKMAHVMFGGLTHQPAVELAEKLVEITPQPLQHVFFADSGSVSVEVAMKMAIQYWQAKEQSTKQKFLTIRYGYHGDTFGAMSVTDPVNGMHGLFSDVLAKNYFVDAPTCKFGESCKDEEVALLENKLKQHQNNIAAIILEPIAQNAGGMRFYSAGYLKRVRELCDQYKVLLITDEIATGFGRTGKLFACEHANIAPDIMCVGKSLTGGYLSLAAALTTKTIAETIGQGEPGLFMHGPTFMANPLACAVALANINLLLSYDWHKKILNIEKTLLKELGVCKEYSNVKDVRVLGAIGVVKLNESVDMKKIQPMFVDAGVWIRPFGKLVYLMPAFNIEDDDLRFLTGAIRKVIAELNKK